MNTVSAAMTLPQRNFTPKEKASYWYSATEYICMRTHTKATICSTRRFRRDLVQLVDEAFSAIQEMLAANDNETY